LPGTVNAIPRRFPDHFPALLASPARKARQFTNSRWPSCPGTGEVYGSRTDLAELAHGRRRSVYLCAHGPAGTVVGLRAPQGHPRRAPSSDRPVPGDPARPPYSLPAAAAPVAASPHGRAPPVRRPAPDGRLRSCVRGYFGPRWLIWSRARTGARRSGPDHRAEEYRVRRGGLVTVLVFALMAAGGLGRRRVVARPRRPGYVGRIARRLRARCCARSS